ncbi:MAG: hypothetical protein KAX53_00710 [Saprospiraceae bacterium]|nr:hypothetical protein [Saprospiraceae bacterium]MBP8212235.1 hypothetical protein [Saprospiraceae bacterium]
MVVISFGASEYKMNFDRLFIFRFPSERQKDVNIEFIGINKVLGINFMNDYKYLDHILAVKYFKDRKSKGEDTVDFILERASKYSLIVLDPGGFDRNSIEYVIDHLSDYPILLLLDSNTYFSIFEDYTCDVKSIDVLRRREVFRIGKYKR